MVKVRGNALLPQVVIISSIKSILSSISLSRQSIGKLTVSLTWSLKLISMLSKFKNKLRTNEAKNRQKMKNSSTPNSKLTGSYKK